MNPLSSTPLEQWLRQHQEQGKVESSGAFTLAREQAWKKLGESQLPTPESWMLKLIQACEANRAEHLKVTQSRTETTFYIPAVSNWTRKRVEHAVFELPERLEEGLDHLAVALRGLYQSGHVVSLTYGSGDCTVWTGKGLVESRNPLPSPFFRLSVSHFKAEQIESWFTSESREAQKVRNTYYRFLILAARWSALKVTREGFAIPSLGRGMNSLVQRDGKPLALLAVRHPALPSGLPPFDEHDSLLKALTSPNNRTRTGGLVILQAHHILNSSSPVLPYPAYPREFRAVRTSRLLWWKDGVCIAKESFGRKAPFTLDLVLNADGLPTDISGLALSDSKSREERRVVALQLARQTLESVGPVEAVFSRPRREFLGTATASATALSPMLLVPWLKPFWWVQMGFLGAYVATRPKEKLRPLNDRESSFAMELRTGLTSLREDLAEAACG